MSCILANNEHIDVFTPGSHGSTFGGNPLACAISIEALKELQISSIPNVILLQKLIANSLYSLYNFDNIISIRGKGMFWGIQFYDKFNLNNLQIKLLHSGYITSTSRNNTLRFSPPLHRPRRRMRQKNHYFQ